MIRYTIKLTKEEVDELMLIINKGSHTTQTYRAAYILLNCDKGEFSADTKTTGDDIAKILKISLRTIERVKKKFVESGFEEVLERKPSSQMRLRKIDGDLEAKLITLCCSEPPEGMAKWSLRLLADKVIELNYVDYISHVTVGKVLKKMNLSLGGKRMGDSA